MDTVFIQGITASTIIGVYERERHRKQKLVVDLEMECDTRPAGKSDQFEDALDYDAITRRVLQHVEGSSYQLIEAVAESLADLLLDEFPLMTGVRIRISKPGALLDARNVGVEIYRP
ncbi:MAG: dihydroneopterin aldolase [Proteobacteria bacterium]|nr:dihydroneopterin aldolase [Pseudomonadota bacterium]